MIDIKFIYYLINNLEYLLLILALVVGLWQAISIGLLLKKRAEIVSYIGHSGIVTTGEYSYKLVIKKFFVMVFMIHFVGVINRVSSDLIGQSYNFEYASFNDNAPEELLVFGLVYHLLRLYGAFVIWSVGLQFSRNQDPFRQRGEEPNSKLFWKMVGGFLLLLNLQVMEGLGSFIKLVPFDAIVGIVKSVI